MTFQQHWEERHRKPSADRRASIRTSHELEERAAVGDGRRRVGGWEADTVDGIQGWPA